MLHGPRFTLRQGLWLAVLSVSAVAVYAALGAVVSDISGRAPTPVAILSIVTLTPPREATHTHTLIPTLPPESTITPNATPSATPWPTNTHTATPTATATHTHTPTPLPTLTSTPTSTHTPLWPSAIPGTRSTPTPIPNGTPFPSLADFWDGRAMWQLDIYDVGLPMGESDTLVGPDGKLWSYLHASYPSRGIRDQWGAEVPFPGCVTLWTSADDGRRFNLFASQCLIACRGKPCGSGPDDIDQQQYPRVARAADGLWYMVYEWRGQTYFRTSFDGLNWSWSKQIPGTGQWTTEAAPCQPYQRIGPHPLIAHDYTCLSGAPPGIFVEGDWLYVFVGMGKNPAHLGCFYGLRELGVAGLRLCDHNPLFTGATEHGPTNDFGATANPYFDFHIISSAEVLKVGERYYLAYEGIRGDGQFNLGLARSMENRIDGPWEKYPGNPILMDVPGNVGLGHADILVLDGITYLYTATSERTRGRYVLIWKP